MRNVLLIVLLVAVIAAIGWFVARSRHESGRDLPEADHPGAVDAGSADAAALASPPADVSMVVGEASPLPREPETVTEREPIAEPEVVAEPFPEPEPIIEPEPPAEPEPIAEPEPPAEPEPIAEPEPPAEPEPVIEPSTEPVNETQGDPLAAEANEPAPEEAELTNADGELAAEHLDPHAGWDHPDDTTVHGDPESGLYHTPDSPGYNVGPDGVDFDSEEAAEKAGFTRWDRPR